MPAEWRYLCPVQYCICCRVTGSLVPGDEFTGHRGSYRVFYGFAEIIVKTVETYSFRLSRRF